MIRLTAKRPPRQKKHLSPSARVGSILMDAVLWIFSLSCIFPLVWMAYNSLKVKRVFNADKLSIPGLFGAAAPTLENYTRILTNPDYHLFESMWNSVRTTAISILGIVLFSFIVGYILSEDPTYITNHNSARSLICKIDRDELLQVLVKSYLEL